MAAGAGAGRDDATQRAPLPSRSRVEGRYRNVKGLKITAVALIAAVSMITPALAWTAGSPPTRSGNTSSNGGPPGGASSCQYSYSVSSSDASTTTYNVTYACSSGGAGHYQVVTTN